jgi:hypothetical protein
MRRPAPSRLSGEARHSHGRDVPPRVGPGGPVRRGSTGSRALALVATLLCAACDFGLVEPASEPSPARLWLDFQFLEPAGSVAGQVALNPGEDFSGPRTVPDESLWVNGGAIAAKPVIGEALIYDVSAALRGSGDSVRIVPPGVTGLRVAPDTVRVALLRIVLPDTLSIPRDGEIEIEVAGCCDALTAGPDFVVYRRDGMWRAVIEPDSAGRAEGIGPVTLTAAGAPRSPLTIPASALDPRLEGGSVEIAVSTLVGLRSSDELYEIDLWQDAITTVPFRVVADGS